MLSVQIRFIHTEKLIKSKFMICTLFKSTNKQYFSRKLFKYICNSKYKNYIQYRWNRLTFSSRRVFDSHVGTLE